MAMDLPGTLLGRLQHWLKTADRLSPEKDGWYYYALVPPNWRNYEPVDG
jgi:hypothetical protein